MQHYNKLIWNKIEDMIFWNVTIDSVMAKLPINNNFLKACEKEFSMTVRNVDYPVILSPLEFWVNGSKTLGDLVREIDTQYQSNYFTAEHGTSVTGVVDTLLDINGNPVIKKWNFRGEALVDRLSKMQLENPSLSILDMGCGVNAYKSRLSNVTGVDPYRPEADIISLQKNFLPGDKKWDVIICFGPMNWYTYDEQYDNMLVLKRCLANNGIIFWSHVHNYEQIFQKNSELTRTWLYGNLDDNHKNSAFFFYDRQWKYIWYFNWTEKAISTLCEHVGLTIRSINYDSCNLYRPPVYRMFIEITH